jgi:hypothetical protein
MRAPARGLAHRPGRLRPGAGPAGSPTPARPASRPATAGGEGRCGPPGRSGHPPSSLPGPRPEAAGGGEGQALRGGTSPDGGAAAGTQGGRPQAGGGPARQAGGTVLRSLQGEGTRGPSGARSPRRNPSAGRLPRPLRPSSGGALASGAGVPWHQGAASPAPSAVARLRHPGDRDLRRRHLEGGHRVPERQRDGPGRLRHGGGVPEAAGGSGRLQASLPTGREARGVRLVEPGARAGRQGAPLSHLPRLIRQALHPDGLRELPLLQQDPRHDCIRVPIPNAAAIYAWIRLGDPIFVYR